MVRTDEETGAFSVAVEVSHGVTPLRLIRAIGRNGVDCPMSRAVRPKASKVPPGRNGWIRPTTVLHGTQDATAGDRVHRPLIATAHRQGFGQSGHAVSRNCRSAKRCLTTAHLGIALEAFACVICPIPSFRLFLELAEGHTSSESCGVKDGRLAGCVDDRNYRETTSVTAQTPTRATRHC